MARSRDFSNINLKLNKDVKRRFKSACRDSNSSMQDVLASFVNLYITHPEKFRIKMEMVMDTSKISSINATVDTKNLDYNEWKFRNFEARQVKINGSERGVFHLNPIGLQSIDLINILRSKIPGCEAGLADPTETLKLPYPIFLTTDDEITIVSIGSVFEKIDKDISELIKKEA